MQPRKKYSFPLLGVLPVLIAAPAQARTHAPENPYTVLYSRPPNSAASTVPPRGDFPELMQDAAGYWQIDFRHLASFDYGHHKVAPSPGEEKIQPPDIVPLIPTESDVVELPTAPGVNGRIPPNVQALDGRKVRITGYMLPVRMENGLVKDFLLLRNQMMCCFGRQPEPNEWVVVRMKGKGVQSQMDTPMAFYGTLHVGEMFENQVFEGLYELDGEKILPL
ncbi:MAG: hypothetical protein JWM35_671 [Verrucomicrobia bacterium]|nr:hypothetical protein [Verrucomicrobiota bacterium]